MRRGLMVLATVLAGAAPGALPASAAEVTDLATAFEEDNPFDLRLRLRYEHLEKRAQLRREAEGVTSGQRSIMLLKDLVYAQRRDTLTVRLEAGVFRDLMVYAELPLVIGDRRELRYDAPVSAGTSSTVQDGIVAATGYDGTHQGAATSGDLAFRGPDRGGGANAFDTLNLGVAWAPFDQRRDDTKPTWVLAFEGQISLAPDVMAFDRSRPDANHSVSDGLHRLVARTLVSRRFRRLEPYVGFWYALPIRRSGSLFRDYGPAQQIQHPQHQVGSLFGLEIIAYERPRESRKLTVDARGRIEAHFSGLGYSEAWEMLASSPALACDPQFNPACDPARAPPNAYQGQPFTGITVIDSYLTLAAGVGVVLQAGSHARFRVGFDYAHDQSHLITNAEVGHAAGGGRVTAPQDYNPAYRQVIDQVGRRYQADDVDVYQVNVWGQLMF